MTPFAAPDSRRIVSIPVHATTYPDATERIVHWARRGESRAVFAANVDSVMQAHDSPAFRRRLHAADLVTPDGVPLVWALRLLGISHATRVYGPDLTAAALDAAAALHLSVGFYGASSQTLDRLLRELRRRWPGLDITYAWSPPFRDLTPAEDAAVVREILAAAPRILFVGLGCPRQELWIAAHRGVLPCVMLGVGAAFDFLAGAKPQAPRWMMRLGLEWLFRLLTEPRRLWRRYLKQNPRFVFLFLRQLLGSRRSAPASDPYARIPP